MQKNLSSLQVKLALVIQFSVLLLLPIQAFAQPDMIVGEQGFFPRAVNDAGQVAGNRYISQGVTRGVRWNALSDTYDVLEPAAGGTSSYARGINASGQVAGNTHFPPDWGRATVWSGLSAATIGATNVPDGEGNSYGLDINDSGFVVGYSNYCHPQNNNCFLTWPTGGTTFSVGSLLVNPQPTGASGGAAEAVNNSGVIAGSFSLFQGGQAVPLGFNPRAVLSNGDIVGDKNGVRVRSSDGTITNIPCGSLAAGANDAGDILAYNVGSDGVKIWHDGQCYPLSSVVPTGFEGWKFPSIGASDGGYGINEKGQVALVARKPGSVVTTSADYYAVFLTPQYPLAIKIVATPTETPGEYEFEAQAVRGNPNETTKWDFGDGSPPQVTGSRVTKKFTKPGQYTVKAEVEDSNGSKASTTFVVQVNPPTLAIGIVLPGHETGEVLLGSTISVEVNVAVAEDGVGELRNLAFQGGTFTASTADILSYTTASTSPFSLSPGSGNVYPLNVKADAEGTVTLDSLLIGEDEEGKPVSAHATREVSVVSQLTEEGGLSASVGEANNAGVVPVTLSNTGSTEATGIVRLTKPQKTSAAYLFSDAAKGKKKKQSSSNLSSDTPFAVSGKASVEVTLKLKNPALRKVKSGKKVKASLQVELTGGAQTESVNSFPVTIKKTASKRKKKGKKKKKK